MCPRLLPWLVGTTDEQRAIVLGRLYDRQKKATGRPKKGGKSYHLSETGKTALGLSGRANVSEKTIRSHAQFARAYDKLKEIKSSI